MSSYGLQTFDNNGNLLFDSSQRTLKILGSEIISGSGNKTIPVAGKEAPFYNIIPLQTMNSYIIDSLEIRVIGNVIRWSIAGDLKFKLIYGRF